MIYIGIDVGKKGALVLLEDDIVESYSFDKETYVRLINNLKMIYNINDVIVGIEKVHSMPKQGVKSMFSFGENYGWLQGILDANNIKYKLISPQEWKKYFGLIGSNKKDSCKKALELEPKLKCYGSRGGMLDGVCDAYLIARYLKEVK